MSSIVERFACAQGEHVWQPEPERWYWDERHGNYKIEQHHRCRYCRLLWAYGTRYAPQMRKLSAAINGELLDEPPDLARVFWATFAADQPMSR